MYERETVGSRAQNTEHRGTRRMEFEKGYGRVTNDW